MGKRVSFDIIGLKCLVQSLCLTMCYVFESVFWALSGFNFNDLDRSKVIPTLADIAGMAMGYIMIGVPLIGFVVIMVLITVYR